MFFTGNLFAAYSVDGGASFKRLNISQVFNPANDPADQPLCCDQVVHYVPEANLFVWILQYVRSPASNENFLRLAVATPEGIRNDPERAWTSWKLSSKFFKVPGKWMDYSDLSFGEKYLYMTVAVVGSGKTSLVARMPLSDLRKRKILGVQWLHDTEGTNVAPVQNQGDVGYFAREVTQSKLRIFVWRDELNHVSAFDVPISSIATEDFTSLTPAGREWLNPGAPTYTKLGWKIVAGTQAGSTASVAGRRSTGDRIWLAWSAGRSWSKPSANPWPQPHIEIAILDPDYQKLIQQRYLWNDTFAIAYPSLTTNRMPNEDGEVAITFNEAGPNLAPRNIVALLTGGGFSQSAVAVGTSAGGHYITIRRHSPNERQFSVGTFIQTGFDAGAVNRPHYVLFERSGP